MQSSPTLPTAATFDEEKALIEQLRRRLLAPDEMGGDGRGFRRNDAASVRRDAAKLWQEVKAVAPSRLVLHAANADAACHLADRGLIDLESRGRDLLTLRARRTSNRTASGQGRTR